MLAAHHAPSRSALLHAYDVCTVFNAAHRSLPTILLFVPICHEGLKKGTFF
jgi:hypothetical protein